jgi:uncharacterized membrane protein
MTRDRVLNFFTSMFLIAGIALVGFFIYNKWSIYIEPVGKSGTTLIAGIVAFVVTFLVLIIVTLCIVALKSVLEKETKTETKPVTSTRTPSVANEKTSVVDTEAELIAVITSAIRTFESEGLKTSSFTEFKVREMVASGSSWRILTRDEFNSVGG